MTNHWTDIDNASLVFVFGANPAENHPACMAHINAARFGGGVNAKNARLIVVDPRLTRTARQCDPARGDAYVRIRPGTNVAFSNALLNWILNNIGTYDAQAGRNMVAWHNGFVDPIHPSDPAPNSLHVGRTFATDAGATATFSTANLAGAAYDGTPTTALANGYPKYCDSRFKVTAAGDDYLRGVLTTSTAGYSFTDFPVIAADVTDPACVYQKLKAHVAAYDTQTVADICGCTEADIVLVAKALIDHSRFKSSDFGAGTSTPQVSTYKATTILYAMGQTQHTNGSQNIKDLAVIQTLMGNMGRAGGGINALRGIHNVQGSTDMGLLFDSIPGYSGNPAAGTTPSEDGEHYAHYVNSLYGNRVEGNTADTKASATVTCTAGNTGLVYTSKLVGTLGNAITVEYVAVAPNQSLSVGVLGNALTVTLGTDASSVVTSTAVAVKAAIGTANSLVSVAHAAGSDGSGLVNDIGPITLAGGVVGGLDLSTNPAKLGLQQRGFFNMTQEWFGNGTVPGAEITKLYDLWPKGNGVQHIQTFRYMAEGTAASDLISASIVWGQNPAITEPNQSAVRIGLKNLDLLVVVDMYETETAAVERKTGGVTYLIPACSHAEEAGSVTNSGRWLQWRERATAPKGNSKADLELLLRFAYALDKAGAFSHLTNVRYAADGTVVRYNADATVTPDNVPTLGVWSTLVTKINDPAYKVLYGDLWTPPVAGVGTKFESLTTNTEMWPARGANGVAVTVPVNRDVFGSEVVAEKVYIELCRPLADTDTSGGTMWIYSGGTNAAGYYTTLQDIQPNAPVAADLTATDEHVTLTGATPSNLANKGVNSTPANLTVKSLDGLTPYSATSDYVVTYGASSSFSTTIARLPGSAIPSGAEVLVTYKYQNVGIAWAVKARAKSRNNTYAGSFANGANNYPRWGWAWLFNRRVFYNNGEVAGDVADVFVQPGTVSSMFTVNKTSTLLADWSLTYRKYKTLKDQPSVASGPHYISGQTLAGRFPGHTEPTESPRPDLVTTWGHNTSAGSSLYWTGANPTVPGTVAAFPLVLTSVRCVEHFQGGPTTRNNSWNVEAEPVPWIEINAADARTYGIADGDWVNVRTARGNSQASQEAISPNSALPLGAHWAKGFKARVGVGLESNQRVARGVVAIPWHWGDKGLSTGSRANDLCIDAWDANTMIPEYKACLCSIEKM